VSILSLFIFVTLIISVIRFPVIDFFIGSTIEKIITTERFIVTAENLMIGFLAAYFFYLLNEYFPKKKRVSKVNKILNSCLASVINTYKQCHMFGHEVAIEHVNTECLNMLYLQQEIQILKKRKTNLLKLKFSVDTAHTRHGDFVNLLQLASELSPEETLQWLVIIDKVRLLSESYEQLPEIAEDEQHLVLSRNDNGVANDYFTDIEFRLQELFEEAVKWLEMK
jgi:hypothetical protein